MVPLFSVGTWTTFLSFDNHFFFSPSIRTIPNLMTIFSITTVIPYSHQAFAPMLLKHQAQVVSSLGEFPLLHYRNFVFDTLYIIALWKFDIYWLGMNNQTSNIHIIIKYHRMKLLTQIIRYCLHKEAHPIRWIE